MDWLLRRTSAARQWRETARTIGQQYLVLKTRNKEASDERIFQTIIDARHTAQPYTPQQLDRLGNTVAQEPSVGEFVVQVLLIENDQHAKDLGAGPYELIAEEVIGELRKLSIEEDESRAWTTRLLNI